MVDALLDTNIIVDILRAHPPALAWYGQLTLQLGVTPIAMMEVIGGAGNKADLNRALQVLGPFQRVDLTSDDFTWAINEYTKYHLSHSVDMEDCLIASLNHRLQLPLYTGNLKHFTPLLGTLAQRPY